MTNPYALLNPVSGIQTLVGTGSSPQQSRIYPVIAPESATLPYIEFNLVTDAPDSTLGGVGDTHKQRYQFSCYALTRTAANALCDAVHAALEGNGYQEYRTELYDSATKLHNAIIDWSFID